MKIFEKVICFSFLSGYVASQCTPDIYQKEWSDLTKEQQNAAKKLKWNEGNWDLTYGVNPITELRYGKVKKSKTNKKKIKTAVGKWKPLSNAIVKKNLNILGIDSAKCFDKWIHHYRSYTWGELGNVETKDEQAKTIQVAYEKMKYTEEKWNEEEEGPLVECKFWEDLSKDESRFMEVVGYVDLDWRWSYYPPIDKDKEQKCITRMKTIYPEKYFGNKRIYNPKICLSKDYEGLYINDKGNCVQNQKCNAYGAYFICEDLLVRKWCDYDCTQYDNCECYSPESYCNSYPEWYETINNGDEDTCVPKDWCDIHEDYYGGDKKAYETDYVKEMVKAHDCF